MPPLSQVFTNPVNLAFFGLFALLWSWEALRPAQPLIRLPWHRARGVTAMLAFFFISTYLPAVVAPAAGALRLADLSLLGTWGGAALVLFLYEGLGYAYHRALHASDRLFRLVHQMHHSAETLDVASAFWFSPLDMAGWTLVSVAASSLFGVTAQATSVFVLASTFLTVFQHANLRTPRWLGYLVQRPESHSLHHARGVHRHNYADLPLFDIVFGTFVNPPGFAGETGYYRGASRRVWEMLRGRDVTAPASSRAG